MADRKLSESVQATNIYSTDLIPIVQTVGTSKFNRIATVEQLFNSDEQCLITVEVTRETETFNAAVSYTTRAPKSFTLKKVRVSVTTSDTSDITINITGVTAQLILVSGTNTLTFFPVVSFLDDSPIVITATGGSGVSTGLKVKLYG